LGVVQPATASASRLTDRPWKMERIKNLVVLGARSAALRSRLSL
jgi:hypothetical protein